MNLHSIKKEMEDYSNRFAAYATTNDDDDDAYFCLEPLKVDSTQLLKGQFYKIMEEWQQLEQEHIIANTNSRVKRSRETTKTVAHPLFIPHDFNYLNLEEEEAQRDPLTGDREDYFPSEDRIINPATKAEYMEKLVKLFKTIPIPPIESNTSSREENTNPLQTPSLFDDKEFSHSFSRYFTEENSLNPSSSSSSSLSSENVRNFQISI
jgi:hypothetical protein